MLNFSSSYSPVHSVRGRGTHDKKVMVTPTYTFTQKTTNVTYPWPSTITGVERIALSAQGDLQRVLSAFFARPISVAVVYSHTYWQPFPGAPQQLLTNPNTDPSALASASPETPIIQRRQVHLQCSGKIVCTATSTVCITSPTSAHLFLVEKYAIGQMFRRLEKMPTFDLVSVELGSYSDYGTAREDILNTPHDSMEPRTRNDRQMWRRYKLTVPSFDCDIVEVFPDRQMFVHGEAWLDDRVLLFGGEEKAAQSFRLPRLNLRPVGILSSMNGLLGMVLLLMLTYELTVLMGGARYC